MVHNNNGDPTRSAYKRGSEENINELQMGPQLQKHEVNHRKKGPFFVNLQASNFAISLFSLLHTATLHYYD